MSSGPESTEGYFIRVRGKVLGPFSTDKLKALRARGQFSRAHEISSDRRSWQPASTLDHLLTTSLSISDDVPSFEDESVVNSGSLSPHEKGVVSDNSGPTPAALWHYNVSGEQHGPVSIMDLRSLISMGSLRSDDFVWKEGLPDWRPASLVPELASLFGSNPLGPNVGHTRPAYADDGIYHTSGFAVASLVLGILALLTPFFGLVFSILAITFGVIAQKAIARSRIALGGRGMALTGLILGTVSLALWAVFMLYWFGFLAAMGFNAASSR